jgi:hypothetical protein
MKNGATNLLTPSAVRFAPEAWYDAAHHLSAFEMGLL